MLFDPAFLWRESLMPAAVLADIPVDMPLAAPGLVVARGHSVRTALVLAVGLTQVGEFSFILSEAARKVGLMREAGHHVLVAGVTHSITVNPLSSGPSTGLSGR